MTAQESPGAPFAVRRSAPFPDWAPGFQAAVERLAIAPRRPAQGSYAGAVRSGRRGRALEFADHRPYVPGDDPRVVDWRTYARLGRLYLKRYDEERARTITLLVDASASLDWGEGATHKGQYGRRLAAALAWIALRRQEPVQAYLLRDAAAVPLPRAATRAAAVRLFRELGAVRESGGTQLAAAVRGVWPGLAPGPTVLLSDLLDASWPEALAALAAGGEGIVVQVLAPDEWEPGLGEEVELEDTETGILCPTRLGPVELAAYRERLKTFLAAVRAHCRRYGLTHVALNTGTPLQDAVLRQLPAAGILA